MKSASPAFIALLSQGHTELVRLWRIVLTSGKVYTFTDGSSPVIFQGELYVCDPGIDISSIRDSVENGFSDATISIQLAESHITEEAVRYRELYEAFFTIKLIHANAVEAGAMLVFAGSIGDANVNNIGSADLSVRGGVGDAFNFMVGDAFSERCRNVFGDSRCKFPIDTLAVDFTVTAVAQDTSDFTTNLANNIVYELGSIAWLTGNNALKRTPISKVDNGVVKVPFNSFFPVKVGDTGKIRPGCNNYRTMCKEKYNNLKNMRSEPDVPNVQAEPPKPNPSIPPAASGIRFMSLAKA